MKRSLAMAVFFTTMLDAVEISAANETEPNDSYAQANAVAQNIVTTGTLGDAGTANDYFVTVPSTDGTIKIYFNYTGGISTTDLVVTAYSRNTTSIGSKTITNQASYSDSLIIYCRATDTMYIRLNCTSLITYSFHYTVITSGSVDVEPNNSFAQAQYFSVPDSSTGHVGYNGTSSDQYDYWVTKLPSFGTLRVFLEYTNTSNTGSAFFYLYTFDKNHAGTYQYSFTNNPPGVVHHDTIYIQCLSPDSIYLRAGETNGCFAYKFTYDITNPIPSANGDAEPNDTRAKATVIQPGNIQKGTIGYTYSGFSNNTMDAQDYYAIPLPSNSNFTFYLNVSSNYDSPDAVNTDLTFSLETKTGTSLLGKHYGGFIGALSDTLKISCVNLDTAYVHISANACWPYSFHFTRQSSGPTANIEYARTGNSVAFEAKTTGSNNYSWNFRNGQTSNSRYPTIDFSPGNFMVKLTVTDALCSIPLQDSVFIQVKGVESFSPKKGAQGGNVLLNVYGGLLDTNVQVKIVKGASIIYPTTKIVNSKRIVLAADFDLHFAQVGFYDVVIDIPGQPTITFANGFEVQALQYPYCRAELTGPHEWRVGTNRGFALKVTNSGNVNANGVVVAFAYPKTCEVTLIPKQVKLDSTKTTTVNLDGELFSLSNALTKEFADSASRAFPIDSLLGQPYDGYLMYLVIPKVPHNATVSIPMYVKTTNIGDRNFYVYSHHPNIQGSCITYHWANTTNMIMSEAIDFAGVFTGDNIPADLTVKTLKVTQKHIQWYGAVAGAHFDAWWNNYDVTGEMYGMLWAEYDEANAFAFQTGIDEVANTLADYGIKNLLADKKLKNEWWHKQMANNENIAPELYEEMFAKLTAQGLSASRLERLNNAFTGVKNLKTLEEKRQTLIALVTDCPELQPQVDALLGEIDQELVHQDPLYFYSHVHNSRDPNAIDGPEGIDAPRYVRTNTPAHYMISCENKEDATAPAQIVVITDTLNPAQFDLGTFTFGDIFIGNKVTRMLGDRNEVFSELSLYPEIPLMARISASLDTVTGAIRWVMVGLDTLTRNLPVSPFLGILPPNSASLMGQASVSYSVKLKNNISNGTPVKNTATIIFDENDPIVTNTWSNSIDIEKPSSSITGYTLVNDTVIKLAVNTSDALSGVRNYTLYSRKNSGEWLPNGVDVSDTLTIIGEPGNTYGFYVKAKDKVGNIENKIAQPEAQVSITATGTNVVLAHSNASFVFPNPTSGIINIQPNTDKQNAAIILHDMTGRIVFTQHADLLKRSNYTLDATTVSNGVYTMQIVAKDGGMETHRLVLIR